MPTVAAPQKKPATPNKGRFATRTTTLPASPILLRVGDSRTVANVPGKTIYPARRNHVNVLASMLLPKTKLRSRQMPLSSFMPAHCVMMISSGVEPTNSELIIVCACNATWVSDTLDRLDLTDLFDVFGIAQRVLILVRRGYAVGYILPLSLSRQNWLLLAGSKTWEATGRQQIALEPELAAVADSL